LGSSPFLYLPRNSFMNKAKYAFLLFDEEIKR
jgi:hypothetical protein